MTVPKIDRVDQQLKLWRERLLDLTKTNPLLCLNHSRVSRLQVIDPPLESLFETLVQSERTLKLPKPVRIPVVPSDLAEGKRESPQFGYLLEPGEIAFAVTPEVLVKRLRRIYDNARTSVQERGVTTLHLAFGFLKWSDPRLGSAWSPVLLVPCELEYLGPSAAMRLKIADEDLQFNPALELVLRERHKLEVPPPLETLEVGGLGQFLAEFEGVVRQRGWGVQREAWLSTFSFESLVIYRDLLALHERARKTEIITALARAEPAQEVRGEAPQVPLDDAPLPDHVPIPVLPADSSQLKALTLARQGRHLVVHGPPGTGKSQTIVNLIADALWSQKTVLFVSAKMAALEVVQRRLASLGLDRFCLEAHSTKAGKARVIEDLRQTLAAAERDVNLVDAVEEIVAKYMRVRKRLNSVVRALHHRRLPLGLTPFEGIVKVCELAESPDVGAPLPWGDVLAASRAELEEALEALRDLGAQRATFEEMDRHAWRGLSGPGLARAQRESVLADLRVVRDGVSNLLAQSTALCPLLGETLELTIGDAERLSSPLAELADIGWLPRGWQAKNPEDLKQDADFLRLASEQLRLLQSLREQHQERWAAGSAAVLTLLSPARGPFASPSRVFRLGYWKWRRRVRSVLSDSKQSGFSFLQKALADVERLELLERWWADNVDRVRQILEASDQLSVARVQEGACSCEVAAALRAALPAELTPHSDAATGSLSGDLREAARRFAQFVRAPNSSGAWERLEGLFPNGLVPGSPSRATPLIQIRRRCEEALGAPEAWHEWVVLQRTLDRCKGFGLGPFLEALGEVSVRDADRALEKLFYREWTTAALQDSRELADFVGGRHEELIDQFRELDTQLREVWLAYVRARASEPARRVASASGSLGTSSEVGTLRRELQKQRRFRPLRRLFADIPHVLQALKPCMLMSPLSVSTFLDPEKISFDLVIFDEASQLPTAEGIPSIIRGRQVIVAGDAKQLPPTSFFKSSVIWDTDDEEADENEPLEPLDSLLDDCVAIYPVFDADHLRWHYRSRDERLIAFSNYHFYSERPLITFPSTSITARDRGVRWEYVPNGIWARGGSRTNWEEAQRVVELVREHAQKYPDRSLGVVTMNLSQRELVEELIDELFTQQPEIRETLWAKPEEPFFVKALENVQGDERDTIIISVGYGRTASGELKYNFGPLNQAGGERRLNVLVTRARWQTILVTSLRATDLSRVNVNNRGAAALRNFIEYAETGCQLPHWDALEKRSSAGPLLQRLAEALAEKCYSVDREVGLNGYRLDLAIRDARNPDQYVLGIEIDGPKYSSVPTARDRDILRDEVLQLLGWRVHRVWSIDWFRDPQRTLARVLASLEPGRKAATIKTQARSLAKPADKDPPPRGARPQRRAATGRQFSPGVPYSRYRAVGYRDVLLKAALRAELTKQVEAIVAAEGPIHLELLAERLKEINGVERVGNKIQENIRAAIGRAIKAGTVGLGNDGFLRRPGSSPKHFRIQTDEVQRNLAWISPEELELAILYVVEDQFACQRGAITKAVAEVFGWARVPQGMVPMVDAAIDRLIREGRLVAAGDTISLP